MKLTNFRPSVGGAGIRRNSLRRQKCWRICHCSFVALSSQPAGPAQVDIKSANSLLTWLTPITLSWCFPETPPHPTQVPGWASSISSRHSTQAAHTTVPPNRPQGQQAVTSFHSHCSFYQLAPSLAQAVTSSGLNCSSYQGAASPTQVVAGVGLHHSLSQVPPRPAQVVMVTAPIITASKWPQGRHSSSWTQPISQPLPIPAEL